MTRCFPSTMVPRISQTSSPELASGNLTYWEHLPCAAGKFLSTITVGVSAEFRCSVQTRPPFPGGTNEMVTFSAVTFSGRGSTWQRSRQRSPWHPRFSPGTWWLIPLSKWVITPVFNGISRVNPLITGVITHLLSGMSHQVEKGDEKPWSP